MANHSDDVLMRKLATTPDDLKANHAGKLGRWQREQVAQRRQQYLIGGAVFAAFVIVGLLLVRPPLAGLPGIVLGLILLIALAALVAQVTMLTLDLNEGRVNATTGEACLSSHRSHSAQHPAEPGSKMHSTRTYVTIGDQRFPVPGKVQHAFRDGRVYTVYYLPRSKVIVGAEFEAY